MKNLRFIGSKSFNFNQSYYFFGRERVAERMFQNLLIENTALLLGDVGSGKTSILHAGISPLLENSGRLTVIPISAKNSYTCDDLYNQFDQIINSRFSNFTYIDKLISNKRHIWYYLKKVQAQTNKIIVLIIDDFDSLNETTNNRFRLELNYALKGQIPEEFKDEIAKEMPELSEKGKELLNTPTDIKMIWSAMPSMEQRFNNLSEQYNFNPKNNVRINYFSVEKAKDIIKKTTSFKSKYKDKNNFETTPYNISDELLENIFAEFTEEKITPLEIQIIGMEIQRKLKEQQEKDTNANLQINLKSAVKNFYNEFLEPNLEENHYNFLNYLVNNNDNKNIPLSQIPENFCNTFNDILKPILNNQTNTCNIYFKSNWLKNELQEILSSPTSKIKKSKKGLLPSSNKGGKNNCRSYKLVSVIFLILSIIGIYSINRARKTAQDNKQLALSNMYAAYSYKNIKTDPTLSFRYAQKAYEHYPQNSEAYNALLNAYYNTEVFYSLQGSLPPQTREAVISPNGKYILTTIENAKQKKAVLYSIKGKKIKAFMHNKPVYFTGFSHNSKQAIFADAKGLLFIYDVKKDELKSIKVCNSRILYAQLDNQNNILILCEKGLKLFDQNGSEISIFKTNDTKFNTACLSEDGQLILSATGSEIDIFNSNGKLQNKFNLPLAAGIKYPLVTDIKISKDKTKFLIAVNDMLTKTSQLILCDKTGKSILKFGGHNDWIRSACFSPDESHILTASYDKTAIVLDLKGKQTGILKGHKSSVSNAVFLQNNETVLTVGDDAKILQWKFGRLINPLAEFKNIDQAIFSPSELKILIAADTILQLQNIFGKPETNFNTNGQTIKSTKFSKDKKYIYALTKSKSIMFWKPNGNLIKTINNIPKRCKFIDFYADSTYVLYQKNDTIITIQELFSGKLINQIHSDEKINYACFSQKTGQILISKADGFISIMNSKNKIIRNLKGHTASVKKAIYSPDEENIISISKDKTAKIWDVYGEMLHDIPSYNTGINNVIYSPNGKSIVISTNDNKIQIYTNNAKFIGNINYSGRPKKVSFSSNGDYIITMYSTYGKNTAKIQHISPEIILRYVNEDKVFGNIQEFDIK